MKNIVLRNKNSTRNVFLLLIFLSFSALGQDRDNKWAVTFGSGSVLYTAEDASALTAVSALDGGSRYILQFPRFSVARYMGRNVTFVASFSSSFEDSQNYTSYDGEIRYDFGTSENKISPYIMLGGSIIKSLIHIPTLNFGGGGTLWISESFGLHGQLAYRFNEERFASQRSHIFGSAGLVYRFTGSNEGKSRARYSTRKRIWNRKP